jgi:hypothetical protein
MRSRRTNTRRFCRCLSSITSTFRPMFYRRGTWIRSICRDLRSTLKLNLNRHKNRMNQRQTWTCAIRKYAKSSIIKSLKYVRLTQILDSRSLVVQPVAPLESPPVELAAVNLKLPKVETINPFVQPRTTSWWSIKEYRELRDKIKKMRQERAEDRRRHVRKVVYNPHSVSHPKTVDVAAKLKKRQVKNGVPVRRESAPDRNGKKLGSVPTLHVQQFGESNRAPSMRPTLQLLISQPLKLLKNLNGREHSLKQKRRSVLEKNFWEAEVYRRVSLRATSIFQWVPQVLLIHQS